MAGKRNMHSLVTDGYSHFLTRQDCVEAINMRDFTDAELRKLCQCLTIYLMDPNHIGPLCRFLGVKKVA